MSKNTLKIIFIFIALLIFIYAFSSSYTVNSIDNVAFVTGMGIDLCNDNENLQVTFEFIDTSSFNNNESSKKTSPIIDSVTAKSVNNALNLLNEYVGKEINLSHCKVIIISDELAKKGIFSEATELMNNIEVRPTTNLIISKCKAYDYISKSSSTLEKVLTKYYDIFPNSSSYTGYTSNITIGKFYSSILNNDSGNLSILGGLNQESSSKESSSDESNSTSSQNSENSESSETTLNEKSILESINSNNVSISSITAGNSPIIGERGTENIGLAVFKSDKYIGDLTALETLCHTMIQNEVNSFVLSIDDTNYYSEYITLHLLKNTTTNIKIDSYSDSPKISIKIKLFGEVIGTRYNSDSSKTVDEKLNDISEATNKYIESKILDYLNKTKLEYKCDIDYFYKFAKHNFLTNSDWENYNWTDKFLNSSFDVTVDSKISSSLVNSY